MSERQITMAQEDIASYLDSLEEEGRSANTRASYAGHLSRFQKWCDDRGITSMDDTTVYDYCTELEDKGYSPSTIHAHLSAINGLISHLGWEKCVVTLKGDAKTDEEKAPVLVELPEPGECDKLLAKAYFWGHKRAGLMIEVFLETGIRVSELSGLTVKAVRKGSFVAGSGKQERTVELPETLRAKLMRYIKESGVKKGAIFVSRTGHPLTRSQVWVDIRRISKDAEVDESLIQPRNLRRLFAVNHYNEHHDILALAQLMGISNLSSLEPYLQQASQG